jgi:hypothetical protein
MYAAGDIRDHDVPDAAIVEPTDALLRASPGLRQLGAQRVAQRPTFGARRSCRWTSAGRSEIGLYLQKGFCHQPEL